MTPVRPDLDSSASDDGIDPEVVAILQCLWEADQTDAERPWSLPKLSKRLGLYMSTLQRHLTALTEAGLVQTSHNERGVWRATLTDEGRALCQAIDAAQ